MNKKYRLINKRYYKSFRYHDFNVYRIEIAVQNGLLFLVEFYTLIGFRIVSSKC